MTPMMSDRPTKCMTIMPAHHQLLATIRFVNPTGVGSNKLTTAPSGSSATSAPCRVPGSGCRIAPPVFPVRTMRPTATTASRSMATFIPR